MLFWLFVITLIIGIGLIVVGNMYWCKKNNKPLYYDCSILRYAGWFTIFTSGIVILIMLICIFYSYTNVEANLEENREIYNALTYKMESTTCRDEFGFLSKEVIDEVQGWNQYVRHYQAAQNDFWIGVFYPNVYDEFKTIDYESYNNG